MSRNYFFAFAFGFLSLMSFSQQRHCGSQPPPEEWNAWFNARVEEFRFNQSALRRSSANTVIPVIIHVIHSGQAIGVYPNLSQSQVTSQISVLNADYAGTGYNVGSVPAPFQSLVANTGISFCLAMLDPTGASLAEPGIDRVNYISHGWNNPASYATQNAFMSFMDNTVKPATIWDPSRYLNIWVSDVNQGANMGLLGYATFPPSSTLSGLGGSFGTASTDGVWVYAKSFGSTGTLNPPYNRGRTATHEIGHYLGLRHIWGDGTNCTNNTDYCNDTPPQLALHYGCPAYPSTSCSNTAQGGDMFMNFMDYSDDACLYMFTPDQNTRMQTALSVSSLRRDLAASAATLCNVQAQQPTLAVSMGGEACIDTLFLTTNNTSGVPVPTYSWSATPANSVTFSPSSTAAAPTIYFGVSGNVTVAVTAFNSAGYASDAAIIAVADCSPFAGLKQNSLLQMVALAPNPASDRLDVRVMLDGRKDLKFEIVDMLGQTVYSESRADAASGQYDLDLSGIANGIYFVNIGAGGERTTRRLVVNR